MGSLFRLKIALVTTAESTLRFGAASPDISIERIILRLLIKWFHLMTLAFTDQTSIHRRVTGRPMANLERVPRYANVVSQREGPRLKID